MTTITGDIAAQSSPATTVVATGLDWPPTQPAYLGEPSGEDPTGLYPLLSAIRSVELLAASSAILSPENRVTEYLDRRTEVLRAAVNQLIELCNLLPHYFLQRDGMADGSYMRRSLDFADHALKGVAEGTDPQDGVVVSQILALQAAVLSLQASVQAGMVDLAGTNAMTGALDMGGNRVTNVAYNSSAQDLACKLYVQGRGLAFFEFHVLRTGINSMAGILDMSGEKIVNVAYPSLSTDLANKYYTDEQLTGVQAGVDIPTGMLFPFCGSEWNVPPGYLLCDGRSVSRSTYPALYAVLGSTYGASTASSFRLPDLRGRVPVGLEYPNGAGTYGNRLTPAKNHDAARVLGGRLGEELHTLVDGENATHAHPYADGTEVNDFGATGALTGASGAPTSTWTYAFNVGRSTENAGTQDAHNNVQPSLVVNWIVRY